EEVPILLCVGVICHRKNQNALIQALDPLAKQIRFRLVFLGGIPNGSYGDDFEELLKRREWCEHHGFATRESLREWFGKASLLFLPSLEDNCPMAVLESKAAGVPVIAAEVGGLPDLLENRVTGLFCDPLDLESMRTAAEELLSNHQLALQLAKTAREQAFERYHPLVVARQHSKIYYEIAEGRSARL